MEALAGYDSSDNEEHDVSSPVASSSGAKKGNTDVARGDEAKSSKVLSISFLPPEIQAGLRGELEVDSDDEVGVDVAAKTTGESEPSRGKVADSGVRSGLLKMLPNPKNEYERNAAGKINPSTTTASYSGRGSTRVLPESTRNVTSAKGDAEEEEDKEENEGGNLLFNSTHRKQKPPGEVISTKANAISAEVQAYHKAAFAQQQQQNTVAPVIDTSNASSRAGSSSNNNNNNNNGSGGNKRKRDRELEQQLLSGNMSALDGADGVTKRDMKIDGNTWEKEEYLARKEEEAKIRREFNVSETSMGSMLGDEKTKTQRGNSKYQLSSLVAQAVRDKVNLVEKKKVQKANLDDRRAKYGF
jgi:hypothetical protein